MSNFYRQRQSVNSVESTIKKISSCVNQVENIKKTARGKLIEGLGIKNIDTLLEGIKWINNDARGQVDWLRTNLSNIYYDIDEKESREKKWWD